MAGHGITKIMMEKFWREAVNAQNWAVFSLGAAMKMNRTRLAKEDYGSYSPQILQTIRTAPTAAIRREIS
jgi:hypothetical protein